MKKHLIFFAANCLLSFSVLGSLYAQVNVGSKNASNNLSDKEGIGMATDTSYMDTCACNALQDWYKPWKANGKPGGYPEGFDNYVNQHLSASDSIRRAHIYYEMCLNAINTDASNYKDDTFALYWNKEATDELAFLTENFKAYLPNSVTCLKTTAIAEVDLFCSWNIFPNPVERGANLFLETRSKVKPGNLFFYDLQGNLLWANPKNIHEINSIQIPTDLQAGFYLIMIMDEGGIYRFKIMIQ